MKKISLGFLALSLWPMAAFAAPAEDHWSVEADPATIAAFERAAGMIDAEDFASALPLLRSLALDNPANADVFNLLGFAHRKLGDLEESGRAYARALYLEPNHLGALEYQGELFLQLDDLAGAEANLARLKTLCAAPCEEEGALAEAIAAWRIQNKP